jgi:hypothetical protein
VTAVNHDKCSEGEVQHGKEVNKSVLPGQRSEWLPEESVLPLSREGRGVRSWRAWGWKVRAVSGGKRGRGWPGAGRRVGMLRIVKKEARAWRAKGRFLFFFLLSSFSSLPLFLSYLPPSLLPLPLFLFFLVVLAIEFRASCLLDRGST